MDDKFFIDTGSVMNAGVWSLSDIGVYAGFIDTGPDGRCPRRGREDEAMREATTKYSVNGVTN